MHVHYEVEVNVGRKGSPVWRPMIEACDVVCTWRDLINVQDDPDLKDRKDIRVIRVAGGNRELVNAW